MENTVFFWAKKLMEIWYLLITEKFLFWTFRRWDIQSSLKQRVDGSMIFTDYWIVHVLKFFEMGNTVFFEPKSWWKMIFTNYWKVLVLNFLVMKIRSFFSQKVDGKMIFTWYFWAFHDIPGLGKNGLSCSGSCEI